MRMLFDRGVSGSMTRPQILSPLRENILRDLCAWSCAGLGVYAEFQAAAAFLDFARSRTYWFLFIHFERVRDLANGRTRSQRVSLAVRI